MSNPALQDRLASAREQARSPSMKPIRLGTRTVSIPTPFPSPGDWRDQWIYFLLVDRFNNPEGPPQASWDGVEDIFQGGTFNGVRQQLGYLHELGVGAIWLSPVLKSCQYQSRGTYHGYGIQDFVSVEPRFGSKPELAEQELRALIDEAHAHGIYVILDIVLNHAGNVFEYVLEDGTSSTANWQDHPYSIRWHDALGQARPDWENGPVNPDPDAAVWPQELQRNVCFRRQGKGGEAGGDFESLKEFVTGLQEATALGLTQYPVRNALIAAHQYLIAKFDVDGYRIDTLKYIEPEFARIFGNAIREFALSLGKKNFLTFGEVYDSEDKIAAFIGRNTTAVDDVVGVDAALDFPLFYKLPNVAKGLGGAPPQVIVDVFENRKRVEQFVLTSHGEAGKYFVTFLDNHDQKNRFYYRDPSNPSQYDSQVSLALGLLFSLQGIPCVYYGTEQGLHGAGDVDHAVREALWGKPNAFDRGNLFYVALQQIAKVRGQQPALRYGRQYFRPISGNGVDFGISSFPGGIIACSRILQEQEVLVVANSNTATSWAGHAIVDSAINEPAQALQVLFSNKRKPIPPKALTLRPQGAVEIQEADGRKTNGPLLTTEIELQPMEIQILGR